MNTGKNLETLVSEIEKILLPNGFKIESNKKIFEDGVQVNEFDLIISGSLGSSSIFWLIECRDRPSGGPQPRSWIEQLIGRRDSNKFNKVTAVSSTGFALPAISLAKKQGIDLHVVENISSEEIITWWEQTTMTLVEQSGISDKAQVFCDPNTDIRLIEAINDEFQKINQNDKILISKKDGSYHSIGEAWNAALQRKTQMFEGMSATSGTRRIILETNYTNPKDRFQIKISNKLVDIVQINFHAELKIIEHVAPINRMLKLSDPINKKAIDHLVDYIFIIQDQSLQFTMHKIEGSEEIVFTVKSDST